MKKNLFKILIVLLMSFVMIVPVRAIDGGDDETNGNTDPDSVITTEPTQEETTTTVTTTSTTKVAPTTKKSTTTKATTKAKSSNNYLSKILVDGEEIDGFDKTINKYNIKVDYDTKTVKVKAIAEDENATIKVEGSNKLSVGDNEFSIGVTSEDGTTKFYKLIIQRQDKEASSNTKLKNLKVDGYHIDFDSNSKTFYVNLKDEDTELDITATPKDENATVKITGNEDLEDGSIVKITVTAENGDKSTYRIIIEKKESNPLIFIIIGIIALIAIGVGIFVLIQKNKSKKEKKAREKLAGKNKKENVKPKKKQKEYDEDEYDDDDEYEDEEEQEEDNDELERTKELRRVDNDEEETRMFSYEEDDLEKTKIVRLSSDDKYDFDTDDEEDDYEY